jgi:stage IV sporulation protein FB
MARVRLFSSGFIDIGRVRGMPLRVHWTTPIGVFLLSGFSFNPLVWIAILGLMIAHELGHAMLARRYRLRVVSIDVTPIGGVCRLEGDPTVHEAAVVAWGGVLAQAVILVIALLVQPLVHVIAFGLLDGFFDTLIRSNLVLMALNLLPVEPLDGAMAWRVFRRFR